MGNGVRRWMVCLFVGMMGFLQGCAWQGGSAEQMDRDSAVKTAQTGDEGARMGRYLEREVMLPEEMQGEEYRRRIYLQRFQNGQLAVLDINEGMFVSEDWGESWEQRDCPLCEAYCKGAYVSMVAISPDGAMAVIYNPLEDEEEADTEAGIDAYRPQYGYMDADGNVKDLTWSDEREWIHQFWFGKDGRLYGYAIDGRVYEMDLQGEAHKQLFEMEGLSQYVCFTKHAMVVFGSRGVLIYDLESGMLTEDQVLEAFVTEHVGDKITTDGDGYGLAAAEGEEEDVLYLAYSGGLYRHVLYGAAMEQVADGSMNSLGDPRRVMQGFAAFPGDEFVILYDEGKLYRYVYDPDLPMVPKEEVCIYGLLEDEAIRQAVSLYQREHPEVYIRYEIGLSGDHSMTSEDAVKNLNTRILAGEGPDLLALDGLPMDSYIEKGVLTDLSGVVYKMQQETSLFENLIDACRDEGKLWYVPVRFRLPLVVGDKESVARIQDLASLADEVEALRERYPSGGLTGLLTEEAMLRELQVTSSGAWMDVKTHQIDEEKLTDFLVQARRIYQAEIQGYDERELSDARENVEEYQNSDFTWEEGGHVSASAASLGIATKAWKLGVGQTYRMDGEFNLVTTLANQEEDFAYAPWDGQVAHGFCPAGMVGICAGSEKNERVLDFFRFLYGETLQDMELPTGFPINERSFARLQTNPRVELYEESAGIVLVSSESDDLFSLELEWSPKEDFERLQKMAATASTICTGDDKLIEIVCETGVKALNGSESVEHVVAEIVKKTAIYLAE